ncbi:hypothetical protein [Embleya sp. NPDC005575]
MGRRTRAVARRVARLQAEAREAVVALHWAREAAGENVKES